MRKVKALILMISFLYGVEAFPAMFFKPKIWSYRQLLELSSENVSVNIENGVAGVTITDIFNNRSSYTMEGEVIMPIPDDTVVTDMSIIINGKEVKGEVLNSKKAKNIYQKIVRKMKDPLLAEWAGKNLIRVKLFPIPARGSQKVKVFYTSLLPVDNNLYKFTYLLKQVKGWARQKQTNYTFSLNIKSDIPISTVYSPTHKIKVIKKNEKNVNITFEGKNPDITRDFELFYSLSKDNINFALLTYKKLNKSGYFLMLFKPKAKKTKRKPVKLILIMDTSGSMAGDKIANAKKAIIYSLNRLKPDDLFNLILFSSDTDPLFKKAVYATKENIDKAKKFIKEAEATGGTAIYQTLKEALNSVSNKGFSIVFATDGLPTVGPSTPKEILNMLKKNNTQNTKIFVFGIGYNVNTFLLDKIASHNNGYSNYVKSGNIEIVISSFVDKILTPALENIELEIKGVNVKKILPHKLPILFKGERLIVLGRYDKSGKGEVVLHGNIDGKAKTFEFNAIFKNEARKNKFIPKLWATRRVAFLMDQIRLNGVNQELKKEVTELGKKYGIVTPYTSYLIKEEQEVAHRFSTSQTNTPIGGAGFYKKLRKKAKRSPAYKAMSLDNMQAVTASPIGSKGAKGRGYGKVGFSGKNAVAQSKAIHQFKKAESLADSEQTSVAIVRSVGDKTFNYKNGEWIDTAMSDSTKVIKIKLYSALYFDILSQYPDFKDYLSLGSNVTVKLKTIALKFGKTGKKKSDKSLLKKIGDEL